MHMRKVGRGATGKTDWPGMLPQAGKSDSGFEIRGGIGTGVVVHTGRLTLVFAYFAGHLISPATGQRAALSRAKTVLSVPECSLHGGLLGAK